MALPVLAYIVLRSSFRAPGGCAFVVLAFVSLSEVLQLLIREHPGRRLPLLGTFAPWDFVAHAVGIAVVYLLGVCDEVVLLMQDRLRLFLRGNIHAPISDEPPANGDDDVDQEDQGQKAFNYRTEPVGPNVDPSYNPKGLQHPEVWLANPSPATPVWHVPQGAWVRLHLIGATDKPRNQSFTLHGVTWPEWRFLPPSRAPRVASESAITTGTARTFEFRPEHPGDHAYRSGILKWAVPQGLWGILRVR